MKTLMSLVVVCLFYFVSTVQAQESVAWCHGEVCFENLQQCTDFRQRRRDIGEAQLRCAPVSEVWAFTAYDEEHGRPAGWLSRSRAACTALVRTVQGLNRDLRAQAQSAYYSNLSECTRITERETSNDEGTDSYCYSYANRQGGPTRSCWSVSLPHAATVCAADEERSRAAGRTIHESCSLIFH